MGLVSGWQSTRHDDRSSQRQVEPNDLAGIGRQHSPPNRQLVDETQTPSSDLSASDLRFPIPDVVDHDGHTVAHGDCELQRSACMKDGISDQFRGQ